MTVRNGSFSVRVWSLLLVLLVTVSALVAGVGVATAQETTDESAVVADIHENGTVDLTLVLTYDLSETSERDAFESIQSDETLLQEVESRFTDRIERVANASAAATNREMTVTDTSVTLETTDSTGIVQLGATVTNLASVDGSQVSLTHPFSSGFQTDRVVSVTVPPGYAVDSVTPEPDERSDGTLTWAADTSLDGFELVATDTDEGSAGTTDTSVPGMGILVGSIAVVGASVALLRRR